MNKYESLRRRLLEKVGLKAGGREVVEFGCPIPSRFLRRVRSLNFPSMPFKPLN
jgi:hypothetical protein